MFVTNINRSVVINITTFWRSFMQSAPKSLLFFLWKLSAYNYIIVSLNKLLSFSVNFILFSYFRYLCLSSSSCFLTYFKLFPHRLSFSCSWSKQLSYTSFLKVSTHFSIHLEFSLKHLLNKPKASFMSVSISSIAWFELKSF